jgi:hypothetical protein
MIEYRSLVFKLVCIALLERVDVYLLLAPMALLQSHGAGRSWAALNHARLAGVSCRVSSRINVRLIGCLLQKSTLNQKSQIFFVDFSADGFYSTDDYFFNVEIIRVCVCGSVCVFLSMSGLDFGCVFFVMYMCFFCIFCPSVPCVCMVSVCVTGL